jgi:hypothetical protein
MPHHLNDEHMRLYEWSGAGTGMAHTLPTRSRRGHPWQASHAVLALLTSLLILNGCDSLRPAEPSGESREPLVKGLQTPGTDEGEKKPGADAPGSIRS